MSRVRTIIAIFYLKHQYTSAWYPHHISSYGITILWLAASTTQQPWRNEPWMWGLTTLLAEADEGPRRSRWIFIGWWLWIKGSKSEPFKKATQCANIMQILCKYYANIVQILCKYCANIMQIWLHHINFKLWLHAATKCKRRPILVMLQRKVNLSWLSQQHWCN